MRKIWAAIVAGFTAIGAALAPAPPCDVAKVIAAVTSDPAMRAYLATVPVNFVDGQPICNGHKIDEETRGCFYVNGKALLGEHDGKCHEVDGPCIAIATVTFNHRAIGAWLFEDEIVAHLAHEFRHAMQDRAYGKTAEPIGTTWRYLP